MHSTLTLRHNVVPYPRFGGAQKGELTHKKRFTRELARGALAARGGRSFVYSEVEKHGYHHGPQTRDQLPLPV